MASVFQFLALIMDSNSYVLTTVDSKKAKGMFSIVYILFNNILFG